MISIKSILNHLYRLFVVSYVFFFISVKTPFGGVTVDRFLTMLIFLLIVIKSKHYYSLYGSTIFLLIGYVTLNKLFYIDELSPKYFIFVICMITLYNSYRIGKLNLNLNNCIVISYFFILIICVYSIYNFFTYGVVPSSFRFLDSISFIRTVNYEHMDLINQSYIFPRLSLPWPTPPQLSIVLAIYSLYFLHRLFYSKSYLSIFLLVSSIFFMLTTISRSGIIPFFITAFVYYVIQSKSSFFLKYFKLMFFVLILIAIVANFNEDLYTIIIDRFFSSSMEDFTSGHSSARIIGLELFMDGTIFQMLFGQGIGNYIGLHAHMTTITFLVEIGLIGLALFIFLFYQRIEICYRFYKKFPNNSKDHLFELMLLILVFFGMALYEFTYVLPIYIFMGLAAGNSYNESKQLKST